MGGQLAFHPHIPNDETLEAMSEANEHLRQLKVGEIQPRFNNVAEFLVSLLSEEQEANADT